MKRIAVLRRNKVIAWAYVDDADYEEISAYRWGLDKDGYAVRAEGTFPNTARYSMHRQLLNPPSNLVTDHINRNKLDNRRCNLRIVTRQENNRNVGPRAGNSTGYKGVSLNKGRYVAQIRFDGKSIHIGRFGTKEEAAMAYDSASLQLTNSLYGINSK